MTPLVKAEGEVTPQAQASLPPEAAAITQRRRVDISVAGRNELIKKHFPNTAQDNTTDIPPKGTVAEFLPGPTGNVPPTNTAQGDTTRSAKVTVTDNLQGQKRKVSQRYGNR